MVAFNVVEHFRHQNDLHAYRRKLAHELDQDFVIRLLPALLTLPIGIVDTDGTPATLDATYRVTLAGPSGSGRRLALQQWATRWTSGSSPRLDSGEAAPAPMLVAMPRLDDGATPPEQLIAGWLGAPDLALGPKPQREGLALFRRTPDTTAAPGQLLIYGWEELPAERRDAWRTALIDLGRRDAYLHIAVTLPESEPAWPSYTPLAIAPATTSRRAGWIERLAPAEHCAALIAALAPGGPLEPLGERLFDVALLARRSIGMP
jgi:hypothetical protein